ncbi:bifunctional DNA primase/polymerase [Streptomyces sp. NPDC056149]|uniref:bifunctional DNA primase/polymerase n=1 Tax=unclassified Streptomyces TaxID=2593676 RepID=UPI0023812406|nr:bifunctional DNA primase/polymerase [Streptomyces sp. WZ-12]
MAMPRRHAAPRTAHPSAAALPPEAPAAPRPTLRPVSGPTPRASREPAPALPAYGPPLSPADAHHAALAHALAAAERGHPVIPLTRTKLPALRSPHHDPAGPDDPNAPPCHGRCGRLGHGVHDAATDPLAIRRMFATAPWATGYGIACGRPPHHLIGLDLDTKHGADGPTALRLIARAHGLALPPTVTVLTPSGGRHLWFTGPPAPPVPNSAGRLAPGVDVRGAGGYLVGPGSLTTQGRYVLAPDSPRHPAPVPPALLTLLLPPLGAPPRRPHPATAAHGHQPPAVALLDFVRDSPRGQRNSRLFWAACRAHEAGLGPELAERLLAAARRTGLPEAEARATLASAARR